MITNQTSYSVKPTIPLSLYVHIPWCERKCPYCDFNSHEIKTELDENAYIDALLHDLSQETRLNKESLAHRELQSLFIGGGTPSLFSAEAIERLIEGIKSRLDVAANAEITIEANPSSAETNRFKAYRQAGVNRLSLGAQSFENEKLKALGRIHHAQEAIDAANYARLAGFDNFNIDLMFGLPEQSLSEALSDLRQAIKLKPSHLSCYQLTIEPNTLFHHQPPVTPDDESLWDMQEQLQASLMDNGYKQYEVSAYAKNSHYCKHNRNYWEFGDYLGIGAGAHSKITLANHQIQRSWKIKHPKTYQARIIEGNDPTGERKIVESNALAFEFMLNALRLTDGFPLQLFTDRTFLEVDAITATLERHESLGLVTVNDEILRLTTRGKSLIDDMVQDYLSV